MIEWYQAGLLAILQGLTEFLPISSSAHLVIPSFFLDWPDQGLAFDVAVHVGSLCAVMLYYRKDLIAMAGDWLRSLPSGTATEDSRAVWYIALATVPAGVIGLGMEDFIETNARSVPVIATTTLVFGIMLGLADRYASRAPGSAPLTLAAAMLIGVAQSLALVPGVSRSGITMTAALFLNMSRQGAARFSFLLSIPVIAGAGLFKTWELIQQSGAVDWNVLMVGAALSGVTAYLCIALFLRFLDRVGFMPFVYYRVLLAAVLYLIWLA